MYLRITVVFMFLLALTSIGAKGCVIDVVPPDISDDGDIGPVFGGTCEDLSGVDFGACEMLMGWGVVEGSCQTISGCDAKGYTFFETQEHCQSECLNLPEPGECDNLAGVDFGACEMHMGWGVVDGSCQPISGCDAKGYTFFETQQQCRIECLGQPEPGICDDGTVPLCRMMELECGEHEVLAIQNECYACVNPSTCKPWGEPGCKDDSECGPNGWCDACGTASCPFCDDCVAACVTNTLPRECETDADCRLVADYCGGCNCKALPINEPATTCPEEEQVQCFAEPCHMVEMAVCTEDGQCVPL